MWLCAHMPHQYHMSTHHIRKTTIVNMTFWKVPCSSSCLAHRQTLHTPSQPKQNKENVSVFNFVEAICMCMNNQWTTSPCKKASLDVVQSPPLYTGHVHTWSGHVHTWSRKGSQASSCPERLFSSISRANAWKWSACAKIKLFYNTTSWFGDIWKWHV